MITTDCIHAHNNFQKQTTSISGSVYAFHTSDNDLHYQTFTILVVVVFYSH